MIDPDHLLGLPTRVIRHRYDRRDTILYALGVGAGQRPNDDSELAFLVEDRLVALPTMAVVCGYPGFWQKEPHYGIDWRTVLHAEQSCTFHAPLPVEGVVRAEFSIKAIVDKGVGRGALLLAQRLIFDEANGRLLATVRQLSFLRGDGGRGGGGGILVPLHAVPDRAPDTMLRLATRREQALLYRLSGDRNPLHSDPVVARQAGFPGTVLHGLCTYGFTGRAVLAATCDNEPTRLGALECRFTAPVFPGDDIDILLWDVGDEEIALQVRVPARKVIVLDRGRAKVGRAAAPGH